LTRLAKQLTDEKEAAEKASGGGSGSRTRSYEVGQGPPIGPRQESRGWERKGFRPYLLFGTI